MKDENTEWKDKVREELIEIIDKFLDVSEKGGWGIKYHHPIKEKYEDGSIVYNEDKINGVDLFIQFGFENKLVAAKEQEKA